MIPHTNVGRNSFAIPLFQSETTSHSTIDSLYTQGPTVQRFGNQKGRLLAYLSANRKTLNFSNTEEVINLKDRVSFKKLDSEVLTIKSMHI